MPNLGIDLKLDIQAYETRNLVKTGHTSFFLLLDEVCLDDKFCFKGQVALAVPMSR